MIQNGGCQFDYNVQLWPDLLHLFCCYLLLPVVTPQVNNMITEEIKATV